MSLEEDGKLPTFLCERSPWKSNKNSIWLASTIELLRNVEKFNFPAKLNSERQKSLITLISESLIKNPDLKKPLLIRAEAIDPAGKEYLSEHFLSVEGFYKAHTGEAFIFDETAEFLATLNINDHLHLEIVENQNNLESAWNRLVKIETYLGKALNYDFLPRWGFLTADPANSGTAMLAKVFLQLPALIHSETVDDILNETVDDSVSITSLHGSPTELVGDILTVSNNYTLGVTEEGILKTLNAVSTKLILEENSARTRIRNENNAEIKDRISRAYGILVHSYQIEAVEALNALSLIKLGLELGWISGIGIGELNELFFNCRRAHLLCHSGEVISLEELPHKRAEFIHRALKEVKLNT